MDVAPDLAFDVVDECSCALKPPPGGAYHGPPDSDRFALLMSQVAGKRLTYAELTGKDAGSVCHPEAGTGEGEPFSSPLLPCVFSSAVSSGAQQLSLAFEEPPLQIS